MKDLLNNEIQLPNVGDAIIRDGYTFRVDSVIPNDDLAIIASITLRGESGLIEIGYYDYIIHRKQSIF